MSDDTYNIFISGYGTYPFNAATREEAEQEAQRKRKHEGAPSCLTWRSDESTEYDRLTSQIHNFFSQGAGCPQSLFTKRKKARELLTTFNDRVGHVEVGEGAIMSIPLPNWLWQMNYVRPEPDRGTKCDDRMLAVGVIQSYLYLIQECTKEEAWRRIKILRTALATHGH